MERTTPKSLLIFLMIAVSWATALAQTSETRTGPSGLIVEVVSSRKPPAGFLSLSENPTSFWASGFPRRADWKAPSTGDPVQAIDFSAKLVGDKGVVTVSVFTGKRFAENVQRVAEISLAEGEERAIIELQDLGFEPVKLKMTRVGTTLANLPTIVNPSKSVSATVASLIATVPTYSVRFVNNSAKAVDAIIWKTQYEGKPRLLGTAAKKYGEKLIEPNGSYEMPIRVNAMGPTDTELILSAVIFEDGTVDGTRQEAENFMRFATGHWAALRRIVPVLEAEQISNLPQLIDAVDAIKDPGPRMNGRPTTAEGAAFDRVVADVLASLRAIDGKAKKGEDVAGELASLRTLYRGWLARLSKK